MLLFLWWVLVRGGGINSPKIPVLVFILWAGLRFRVRGAAAAVFLLAIATTFFTSHFKQGLTASDLVSGNYAFTLQIFVVVAVLVALVPAIVIEERDRTLRNLRESEEKFSKAFRSSPDAMAISDLATGQFIEVNDGFPRIYGYTREEMIGRTAIALNTWRDVADRAEMNQRLARDGAVHNYEGQGRKRSGELFPNLFSAEIIELKGRQCLISVVRDLTAQRQAESALRESEKSLRATIENTPDVAVRWFDRSARVIYWNRASETMHGWTSAEALGKKLDELLFTREQASAFQEVFREIERTGKPFGPAEFPFRRRDGKTGVLLSTVFQIQIPSGEPGFVCMDVDLTQRKRAEALTAAQMQVLEMIAAGRPKPETLETLLRLMEAQTPDTLCSILLLDADGVHVRHGAAPSLPPDFVRAIDGEPIGPRAGSCGTAAFRREPVFVTDIATDLLWADYKHLALPHGLRACWSTPIFDEQKNVLGTFAIYRRQPGLPDEQHRQMIEMVTHTAAVCIGKHRAEQANFESIAREQQARIQYTFQLIAAQEAERKRIAAEIHDSLGQNLLLLKNLAQIALRDQNPASAYEQLADISNLATQCIAEARQMSHELHPYQLEHLGLKRALELLLENITSASPAHFDWKFDELGEKFSQAVATNLYRIVQECLTNILKHSRAQNVTVRLECDIHELLLTIADDGCGFLPETKTSGMGLKNIAERTRMIGGKLKVDSAPGRGTRLEVTLPLAAGEEGKFPSPLNGI